MGIENKFESTAGIGGERRPPSRAGIRDHEFLHHCLEETARSRPGSIALVQNSTNYTFATVDGLANRTAWDLTRQSPGRETLVAVWSADPALQLILTFGVWKAGMSAVILDVRDSESRLRWILDHAGIDTVISDNSSAPRASQAAPMATVLPIDPRDTITTAPEAVSAPDAPALIVFTSGSEGYPKGVVRTHQGMFLQCHYHGNNLGLDLNDRVAQLYPLNYSTGVKQALTALLYGSSLCFYDIHSQGLASFYDWFRSEGITVIPSPVAFFRRVLHHAPDSHSLANCRCAVLGGERLFKRDVDNFRRVFPKNCELIYTYGATECGGIARHVIRGDTPVTDPIPVGTCEDDREVRVLSHGFRELPAGEMGEIAVLGSNLPPGYWKDSAATERKYKSSPTKDGRRMCLTGDVGKIGEDGLLHLYRRNDKQLKVRGYRVDLSEIETVLNNDENVVHAVVMTTEDASGELKVIAYVTLAGEPEDQQDLTRELKKRTAANIPPYMVPDEFVILDLIPTTHRGKIDRQALSAAPLSTEQAGTENAPTETQRKVIEVWKEVFQIKDLSLDDDLLDLGVQSLAGMEACMVLGKAFLIDVPLIQLTVHPTARQFAEFIDSQLAIRNGQ